MAYVSMPTVPACQSEALLAKGPFAKGMFDPRPAKAQ